MRWIDRLIPDDVRNSLNANPTFQWIVVVILVVVGVLLVVKGIGGVRNGRLTGKGDRVFEGTTARILGAVYVALGALLATVAVAVKLSG